MYRVVILSDLHFGESHFFGRPGADPEAHSLAGSLRESLAGYLAGSTPDCLVLAGDFFEEDQNAELGDVREGVREIVTTLAPSTIVAVPGNHDLTWHEALQDDPQYYYKRLMGELADLG